MNTPHLREHREDHQVAFRLIAEAERIETPARARRKLVWWREVLLTVVVYAAYSAIRDFHGRAISPADYARALRDARSVIHVERLLHLNVEHSLQELALHATWFIRVANVFYGSAHFIVTMGVLVWLYRRHPERYRRWRLVLLAGTGVALVGFVTFPVAPPRMLPPSYGFMDTLHALGGLWTFNSGVVERISDPFAALPSLHLCWAVWCAAAVYPMLRRRGTRLLAVSYPIFTGMVVLITGNHFILDVIGGVACVGFGLAVTALPRLELHFDWRRHVDAILVGGLVAAAVGLRVAFSHVGYWNDEAISLGIASHRLADLPRLLSHDGSPPLYYVVLHFWIAVFGTSELATHFLSLLISVLTIPVIWWAANSLFDRRAARCGAVLAACSTFLGWYATETRMYSLVGLLSVLAVTCFLKVLGGERRWWLFGAAASSTLLVYTHYWGLYLVLAMVAVGLGVAWRSHSRSMALTTAAYGGGVGLAFLPWVPTMLFQAQHTAAPWSPAPSATTILGGAADVIGGNTVGVAILVVGVGAALLARKGPVQRTALILAGVALLTIVGGALGARVVSSWAPRYLAVAVGPALLVLAGVLASTRPGRVAAVAAALAMVGPTLVQVTSNPSAARWVKSDAGYLAAIVRPRLRPGDVVIVARPSEVPVVWHYLKGDDLQYSSALGAVADPTVVDWRDLEKRLLVADPDAELATLVENLAVGQHVLLIEPVAGGPGRVTSYDAVLAERASAVQASVLGDPRLSLQQEVDPPTTTHPSNAMTGYLLEKTAT